MGMPLYGQSFALADQKNNGLNAKAPGPGQAGEFTRAAGFLAYYEVCKSRHVKDTFKNQAILDRFATESRTRNGPSCRTS